MFMDMRRSILSLLAVVFLHLVTYHVLFVGQQVYTNSVFWIGGYQVFLDVYFCSNYRIYFVFARQFATMKNWLIGLMILSMVVWAVIYFVRGPFL